MSFLSLDDLKVYGQIHNDESNDSLQMVLDQSESIFKRYLNSPIEAEDIIEDFYIRRGGDTFIPLNRPINSVAYLKNLTNNYVFDETEFGINNKVVIFLYQGAFSAGHYEISYNAGWNDVPKALENGIFNYALWIWQRGDPSAIYQTEALIPENIKEILRQFGGIL